MESKPPESAPVPQTQPAVQHGFEAYILPLRDVPPKVDWIAAVLRGVIRGWLRVALVAFLGAVASFAASFLLPRIYEARVVVMPQSQSDSSGLGRSLLSQLGGLATLAGTLMPTSSSAAESIAVLKSDAFTVSFINEQGLLPVLFFKKWDAERGRWIKEKSKPTIGDALEYFDERIRAIAEDKKTGLVTLTISWRDNEQAAAWANLMVANVNEVIRQRAIREATEKIGYLDRQLQKTTQVELQEVLFRLSESQQKILMLAETQRDYAFRVIDPARVPEIDQYVSPKRLGFAAVGFLAGMLLCAGWLAYRAAMETGE